MNPQPSPITGDLVALLVMCGVAFYAWKAYSEKKAMQISDLFTIGYIESDPIVVQDVKHIHNNTHHTHINHNLKTSSFEDQQLYIDCIDTLVAVGYKKKEARAKAKQIFSSANPPTTVQEFLQRAM